MEPTIDLATPADVDELARLRWQLYREVETELAEPFELYRERFAMFARDALADAAWRAWVAREDAIVVGTAWRYRTPRIPQPGRGKAAPLAYLTNVYVEPASRDRGLGGRLIRHIVKATRSEGFSLAMVWPSEGSYPFYRREGFDRTPDPLTIDLRPSGHEEQRGGDDGTGHPAVR